MSHTPRIPSYRHHRPSNQAVVTINGRDIYLGRHGSPESRAEYDRIIGVWMAGGRKLPANRGADLTIVELIRDYIKFADTYYVKRGRPTTQARLVKRVLKEVRQLHGPEPAADFGPLKLKAIRQAWIDRKLTRTTCNQQTGVVRRLFRWGVEHELIPSSVYEALRAVRDLPAGRTEARDRPPVGPAPDTSINAILPLLPKPLAAVVRLMRATGARPAEILCLRQRDIDRSAEPWIYNVPPEVYKSSHANKKRFVLLGPIARQVLSPWLASRHRDTEYLFAAPEGRWGRRNPHYSLSALESAIRSACVKAGVPHFTPNQIRHTAATSLRKHFGIDAARAILGHGSARMTEVYAEMDINKARAIMESVG
jgi:integrase